MKTLLITTNTTNYYAMRQGLSGGGSRNKHLHSGMNNTEYFVYSHIRDGLPAKTLHEIAGNQTALKQLEEVSRRFEEFLKLLGRNPTIEKFARIVEKRFKDLSVVLVSEKDSEDYMGNTEGFFSKPLTRKEEDWWVNQPKIVQSMNEDLIEYAKQKVTEDKNNKNAFVSKYKQQRELALWMTNYKNRGLFGKQHKDLVTPLHELVHYLQYKSGMNFTPLTMFNNLLEMWQYLYIKEEEELPKGHILKNSLLGAKEHFLREMEARDMLIQHDTLTRGLVARDSILGQGYGSYEFYKLHNKLDRKLITIS